MGAILACDPSQFNSHIQDYNIEQGYGNLHITGTPYEWNYLPNIELVSVIREMATRPYKNTLFFIDEADEVYPPRGYTNEQQTKNLKGIGQHDKLGCIVIYTYQKGKPDDALKGVDKIMRSNTQVDIEMPGYNRYTDKAIYIVENRLAPGIPIVEKALNNVSEHFGKWDSWERTL